MKINIITYHYAHNYGAVFQTFALSRFLQGMGADCEVIDFIPSEEINGASGWRTYLKNHKLLALKLLSFPHSRKIRRCKAKFAEFRSKHIATTKRYSTHDELKKDPPRADIYICGSDQIWNCECGFRGYFFLDFVSDKNRKISYAASIGTERVNSSCTTEFKNALLQLKAVSVREETAQKEIINKMGIKAECNIDPVFLLNRKEWISMEQPYSAIPVSGGYIFCLNLGTSATLGEGIRRMKEMTGLPVIEICINGFSYLPTDYKLYDVGPEELLYLLDHAEYVLTSSFHISALSIILDKPFYVFPKNYSSRIKDLMEKLEIRDRVITQDTLDSLCSVGLDTVKDEVIRMEQEKSRRYFEQAFQGI